MRFSLRKFPIYSITVGEIEPWASYPTASQTTDSVEDYWGGLLGGSPYKAIPDTLLSVLEDSCSVNPAVKYVSHLTFVTQPLFAQTVAADNWTLQMYTRLTRQDPAGSDPSVRLRVYAYVWNANNTKGTEIFTPTSDGTDYVLDVNTAMNLTVAGNAFTLSDGDLLAFEFYHDIQNLNGGTSTKLGLFCKWGGAPFAGALSYVDSPVDFLPMYKVTPTTGSLYQYKVPDTFVDVDQYA